MSSQKRPSAAVEGEDNEKEEPGTNRRQRPRTTFWPVQNDGNVGGDSSEGKYTQPNMEPRQEPRHVEPQRLYGGFDLSQAPDNLPVAGTRKPNGKSPYMGVSPSGGRWRASIRFNGRFIHLGYFDTAEDAAHVYTRAAYLVKQSCSEEETYGGLDISQAPDDLPLIMSSNPSVKSRYKGVHPHGGRWRACLTLNGKDVHLGCSDTEEDAARIYARAAYVKHREKQFLTDESSGLSQTPNDLDPVSAKPGSTAPFCGVAKRSVAQGHVWKAKIKIGGKTKHLGYINIPEATGRVNARAAFDLREQTLSAVYGEEECGADPGDLETATLDKNGEEDAGTTSTETLSIDEDWDENTTLVI